MQGLLKLTAICLLGVLTGCTTLDPRRIDVQLPESLPEVKTTSYTQALSDLGLMTEIYDTPVAEVLVAAPPPPVFFITTEPKLAWLPAPTLIFVAVTPVTALTIFPL